VIPRIRKKLPLKLVEAPPNLVELPLASMVPSLPVLSLAAPGLAVPSLVAPGLAVSGVPEKLARPRICAEVGRYRLRLAETLGDRDAACRLRFRVFNLELGEGLESSYRTGMDTDHFDLFCEHLLVEDKLEENPARRVVGTYRMQSGETAARNLGYYSEQEFDFAPYEPLRAGILELGRASIDSAHRTPEVLTLLWRGIAQYACGMGLRYLIGCSSLNSQDPAEGWQMVRQLDAFRVAAEFETRVIEGFACPTEHEGRNAQQTAGTTSQTLNGDAPTQVKVPRLLRTYLALGARIAAPPAWDRGFGTIDFLTLLDLKALTPAARNRFLAPLTT
jgi:putative hemolysin